MTEDKLLRVRVFRTGWSSFRRIRPIYLEFFAFAPSWGYFVCLVVKSANLGKDQRSLLLCCGSVVALQAAFLPLPLISGARELVKAVNIAIQQRKRAPAN